MVALRTWRKFRLAALLSAVAGALIIAGCGGQSHNQSQPAQPGAGKGVGFGLQAAGLRRCLGPLPGHANVSLSLYAQHGFAALLASGAGAQQHAIDLALIRNHIQSAPPLAAIASTERSWRHEALRALKGSAVPPGPCRSEVPRLPVLAATEVVCQDEVLIPLGRPAAINHFIYVLSTLLAVKVTPAQVGYIPGGAYSAGHYYTTPETIQTNRPYCRND